MKDNLHVNFLVIENILWESCLVPRKNSVSSILKHFKYKYETRKNFKKRFFCDLLLDFSAKKEDNSHNYIVL